MILVLGGERCKGQGELVTEIIDMVCLAYLKPFFRPVAYFSLFAFYFLLFFHICILLFTRSIISLPFATIELGLTDHLNLSNNSVCDDVCFMIVIYTNRSKIQHGQQLKHHD